MSFTKGWIQFNRKLAINEMAINTKTSFFIGGSVLCATLTVVRSFLGHENLYSFCSAEYDNFQKNSNFSLFLVKKSRNRRLKWGNQIYKSFLDQLINYVSSIIPSNSNKTTTFALFITRFFSENHEKVFFFWKCWVSGAREWAEKYLTEKWSYYRIYGAKDGPTYKKRRQIGCLIFRFFLLFTFGLTSKACFGSKIFRLEHGSSGKFTGSVFCNLNSLFVSDFWIRCLYTPDFRGMMVFQGIWKCFKNLFW